MGKTKSIIIDAKIQERLRDYCLEHGFIIGKIVSFIIEDYLNDKSFTELKDLAGDKLK